MKLPTGTKFALRGGAFGRAAGRAGRTLDVMLSAGSAVLLTLWVSTACAQPQMIGMDTDARQDLGVVVYEGGIAVIRDVREATLPVGLFELEFRGISQQIEPASVIVEAPGVKLYEQNYRFDLLNKSAILQRFLGRKLKYSRSVLQDGAFEKVLREGILLSVSPEIVQFGDEVEISPEGTISLGYLPDDLKAVPTLAWLLETPASGPRQVTATYTTSGMSWHTDYVLVLADDGEASFTAWLSVVNRTGVDFDDANLQLVSGAVRQVGTPASRGRAQTMERVLQLSDTSMVAAAPPVALGQYYRFVVPRRTTLHNNEAKQIALIQEKTISVVERLGQRNEVAAHMTPPTEPRAVDLHLEFNNDARRGVGQPLPTGTVRAYREAGEQLLFVGEDQMPHTARDARARLHIGQAFDVTTRRQVIGRESLGQRSAELEMAVTVINAKEQRVEVDLEEALAGTWQLLDESMQSERKDANTLAWRVSVAAGASERIAYRVRFRW